ncbi:glycosyl transferase [Flavobacteriaceae bacterium 3519-10]|nr:glycosyl transferase [Flavobacteriaceae bacterium 3519-10]
MKKLLLTGFALVSMASQAQSWVPQATNFPLNSGVDEIDIVDANVVWTFAYGPTATSYPKIVGRTINGGATWTATTLTNIGNNALISDLTAVDANTAWVLTAGTGQAGANPNRIWKTTNGGTSWTQQAVAYNTPSFANQIHFWNANEGWTAGDPLPDGFFEMYKTTNGGTTWTLVPGRPASEGDYSYVGLKEVVGDIIWIGTDTGRILKSLDRGNTWMAGYSPVLDFGGATQAGSSGSFAFQDADNGLLIAVDGAALPSTTTASLYKSTDGGMTWGDPISPTGPWYFGDITYVPGTVSTYVSTGANPGTLAEPRPQWMGSSYSTDGGLTWIEIDSGEQRGKVAFLNPTTGWAGQFSDGPTATEGIMKFVGNLALGTSDNAVKSSLKVYPNPAVDVVTVSSNKKIENITVIDMSGKKVQSFKAGNQINVSSLAKGTYMLQVYYGGGAVENTKLIKK